MPQIGIKPWRNGSYIYGLIWDPKCHIKHTWVECLIDPKSSLYDCVKKVLKTLQILLNPPTHAHTHTYAHNTHIKCTHMHTHTVMKLKTSK